MDVTIAVATYGDSAWIDLANERAIPSAEQFGVPVVHVHGHTLHDARNQADDLVDTEWVVHLDADDELHPRYLDHLATGTADLRAPAVEYQRNGFHPPASVPKVAGHTHACTADCLTEGNWLVVGTLVRTDLVRQVGGWRDFTWSEDWDLWIRCWQAGATIEAVPKAVYVAHVRPDSRNRAPDRAAKVAAHRAIWDANFGAAA
jgi:cellulose synthase/poly-beta-1,6-N-acetylglucosamine synthase-like glycosyltransferase